MTSDIATRFLIISDTHGAQLEANIAATAEIDVAIHCGDLTEESKLDEFRTSISLLKKLNAKLKLVIAGNHDFTLDDPMFAKKLEELKRSSEPAANDGELIKKEYGAYGEARAMLDDARSSGIIFLDEGMHHFTLANGASLKVFASPYTPSTNDWGFQYSPGADRDWNIDNDVDIVITHGPPEGILDRAGSCRRAGCPSLFRAIARARPRMHCFGHIHRSWGAKKVVWRDQPTEMPSHFTDIDNGRSTTIESLASITLDEKRDTDEMASEKRSKQAKYFGQGYSQASCSSPMDPDLPRTLFVNAAIQDEQGEPQHLPWLVEIALPRTTGHNTVPTSAKEVKELEQVKVSEQSQNAVDSGQNAVLTSASEVEEAEKTLGPARKRKAAMLRNDENGIERLVKHRSVCY